MQQGAQAPEAGYLGLTPSANLDSLRSGCAVGCCGGASGAQILKPLRHSGAASALLAVCRLVAVRSHA